MKRWRIRGGWLVPVLLLLGSCALLPQPDILPVEQTRPEGFPLERYQQHRLEGAVFEITDAWLVIKTYRSGWLKGLAHNHIIATSRIAGLLYVAPERDESFADVFFRPIDLELDDPAMRAAAGAGFESTRTEADIEATRARMLGPSLLSSNQHPFIQVRVVGDGHASEASLQIKFRGGTYRKTVPVHWSAENGRVTVESAFQLTHADLGLRPYSAFFFALAVAQELDVSIKLRAAPRSRS